MIEDWHTEWYKRSTIVLPRAGSNGLPVVRRGQPGLSKEISGRHRQEFPW